VVGVDLLDLGWVEDLVLSVEDTSGTLVASVICRWERVRGEVEGYLEIVRAQEGDIVIPHEDSIRRIKAVDPRGDVTRGIRW